MKGIFILLSIACASILLIVFIVFSRPEPGLGDNGFNRDIKSNLLKNGKKLKLKYNSYYIAGLSQQHIYLGNYTAPQLILQSNYTLTDTLSMNLNISRETEANWEAIRATVDSPFVFLIEGYTPTVLSGTLPQKTLADLKPRNDIHFSKFQLISKTSMVMRTYDPFKNANVLSKGPLALSSIPDNKGVLQKQIDGIFCTDGTLLYSKEMNHVLYIYLYRNQFLCLDTNLSILYKGRTIDTTSVAQIQVDTVHSEQRTTLSGPPLIVNSKSCTSGKYLLVHSALMAINESRKEFEENAVMDVYLIKDGSYQYSFYLPLIAGTKLRDISGYKGNIVAIMDDYLVSYQLPQ